MNPFILAKENADQWFDETVVSLLNEARNGSNSYDTGKNEKRKAFVVVYGHTRSGKTTIVLKLLQIRDSSFSVIYNALCGGRGAGDPTTPPAAFKYTKVLDDRFTFITYDGDSHSQSYANTPDELCNLISDVRDEIFAAKEKVYSVSIGIPKTYFEDESLLIDVDIIDLPGDYPRDIFEYSRVRKVYGYYLQRATRIYFVSPEDKPKVLKQSFIDQQAHTYKSKTRIILTHISQSETEQKEIPGLLDQLDMNECVDVLRDRYIKYIRNLNLRPEIESNQLFAFNAGNAMETMPQRLKELLEPIVKRFIQLIIDDINMSAQPSEILSQFSDIKNEIEGKLQKMKDSYSDAISTIETKLMKATDYVSNLEGNINDVTHEEFDNINYFINNSDSRNDMYRYSLPMLKESYKERCSDFLNYIRLHSNLAKGTSVPEIEDKKRKLFEQIPIDDDDELIQIFSRKRKNVFLFIKGKNPSYPYDIIKHLNKKLYTFVQSKNEGLCDIYHSMIQHLENRLQKHKRYINLLQNRVKILQIEYKTNSDTCKSQIDLCDNYFDNIEESFKTHYLINSAEATKGDISCLYFLLEAYFISSRIIKSKRCER